MQKNKTSDKGNLSESIEYHLLSNRDLVFLYLSVVARLMI
jgi:hypothetical protein